MTKSTMRAIFGARVFNEVINDSPALFALVETIGMPNAFASFRNQCLGCLTPTVVSLGFTAFEIAFLFFKRSINVYGPGNFLSQKEFFLESMQFSFTHFLLGAITENGLFGLPFMSRILSTASLFSALQPMP